MKKSIKNTIMIGMAAVLIGTSAVTISYAQTGKGANNFSPPSFSQDFDGNQNENPFENFSNDGDNQNGGLNQRQMPGNQQNGSNSQMPQPPSNNQNGSSQDQQQPPSNSDSSNSTESDDSSATNTSLSVEAFAAEDSDSQTAQQNMPANAFGRRNIGVISALCYMFAAVQIAIILTILAYLIISKFNDISFNEVLANMRKNKEEA